MATKKLTCPVREDESRYIALPTAARVEQLVGACEVANNSADVVQIERSFDNLADELDRLSEPW